MSWVPEHNAVWAAQVCKDLEARGLDAAAALRHCGIARASLGRKNGTIPFAKHSALLGYAAKVTGDDCYGLHLGAKMDPRDAGLLGYLGLASADLQSALENLCRYNRVASDVNDLKLTVTEGIGILSVRRGLDLRPTGYSQHCEFSVSLFLQATRILTGSPVIPLGVRFGHGRTKNLSRFRQILSCPVEFGQDMDRIDFDGPTMLLPIRTADDRLLEILKSYGDEILARHAGRVPDFRHQVERLIVDLLPTGNATIAIIANELGMSERTFSRRLSDLDLTFKDILADVRRDLSVRYVSEPDLSLKQAAFLLGYSDPSAFSHAFKRWTGKTPAQARQASAGG